MMAMIDALVGDLEKEIQEMEFEEKDAQSEYEEFIEDSANKRATDSKSLTDKEAAKADAEVAEVGCPGGALLCGPADNMGSAGCCGTSDPAEKPAPSRAPPASWLTTASGLAEACMPHGAASPG